MPASQFLWDRWLDASASSPGAPPFPGQTPSGALLSLHILCPGDSGVSVCPSAPPRPAQTRAPSVCSVLPRDEEPQLLSPEPGLCRAAQGHHPRALGQGGRSGGRPYIRAPPEKLPGQPQSLRSGIFAPPPPGSQQWQWYSGEGGGGASARDPVIGKETLPGPTSGPNSRCDLGKSLSISGSVSSLCGGCKPGSL